MPTTPIDVEFSSNPVSANTLFTCTITVASAPSVDTAIQLYCTNTALVHNSSGGAFPTSATVLAGHTTVAVALKTGSPSTATNVTIAAGQPGADMSNSANWQASKQLTVTGTNPP